MDNSSNMSLRDTWELYANLLNENVPEHEAILMQRTMCRLDLFFLLTRGLHRRDLDNEWHYPLIRFVEKHRSNYIYLWFRFSGKSSIITQGLTLQNILRNPESTIIIISYNAEKAADYMKKIKSEMEQNDDLRLWYPDILWDKPPQENWSTNGINVRRKSIRMEHTIETCSIEKLIQGRHVSHIYYDDIITKDNTRNQDSINFIQNQFRESGFLGELNTEKLIIGTRYSPKDLTGELIKKGYWGTSIIPAREGGTPNGKLAPAIINNVPLTEELYEKLILENDMTTEDVFCQLLLNPTGEGQTLFREEWLRFYDVSEIYPDSPNHNIYILVDPASTDTKRSDYTAIVVVALGVDGNYYVVDMVKDKLSLSERLDKVAELNSKWHPIRVGWEITGLCGDLETLKKLAEKEFKYRFETVQLKAHSKFIKSDRIATLEPLFRRNKIYLPKRETIHRIGSEGAYDPIREFIDNEYICYPVTTHEDLLDALSRITDPVVGITPVEKKPTKRIINYSQKGNILG